jgi:hypothetical protein
MLRSREAGPHRGVRQRGQQGGVSHPLPPLSIRAGTTHYYRGIYGLFPALGRARARWPRCY